MIRISFFGGLKNQSIEQGLAIRGINERALLAYFCAEGDQEYARDYLAALLWPDTEAQKARQNLRAALFHLRKDLQKASGSSDHALLTTSRESIQTHFSKQSGLFWSDVGEFKSLENAIHAHPHTNLQDCLICRPRLELVSDLYRGKFIQSVNCPNSLAYENWLAGTQENLHIKATNLINILAMAYLREGQTIAAIHTAQHLMQVEPLHAQGLRILLQALAQEGQYETAKQQYIQYSRILMTGVGIEPDEETQKLHQDIQSRSSLVVKPPCPYIGLAAFGEHESSLFFGRARFVNRLISRLQAHRVVIIAGASGSGKSSVVHAGLIPELHRTEDQKWKIVPLCPGEHLIQTLTNACLQAGLSFPKSDIMGFPHVPPDTNILLVIDSLEEIFNPLITEDVRERFITLLGRLLDENHPGMQALHVVVTLRTDYLSQANQYHVLASAIQRETLHLEPMDREEMREAIERPAAQRSVEFAPGLVGRLLDAIHPEPGNLTLLQIILQSLWGKMSGRRITHEDFRAIGGTENTVVQYAEGVFANFSNAEQELIRRIFSKLIHSQANTPNTHRLAARTEFTLAEWQVVQQLIAFRLIQASADLQYQPNVEISHYTLISNWERLLVWLDEDQPFRLWRSDLGRALTVWLKHRQNPDALLRGPALLESEKWILTHHHLLNPIEDTFITESLAHRDNALKAQEADRERLEAKTLDERRQTDLRLRADRRTRWIIFNLSLFLLFALAAGAFAIRQRNEAQRASELANALNLASAAQLALERNDTDLALSISMASVSIEFPPDQTLLGLANAAFAPGTRRRLLNSESLVNSLVFIPGSSTLLLVLENGALTFWDLQSEQLTTLTEPQGVPLVDFTISPDGTMALTAFENGEVKIWKISPHQLTLSADYHLENIRQIEYLPISTAGDDLFLVGSETGELALREVQSGRLVRLISSYKSPVVALAVSPDGQQALAGYADFSLAVWGLQTEDKSPRFFLPGHTDAISAYTVNGEYIPGHYSTIRAVAFSPDSSKFVSVAEDLFIQVGDANNHTLTASYKIEAGLLSLAMMEDNTHALIGTSDNRILLFNLLDGKIEHEFIGHAGRVQALALYSGRTQAFSASLNGEIRWWDLERGDYMGKVDQDFWGFASLAVSPDGTQLLAGLWDGRIDLLDSKTYNRKCVLSGQPAMIFGGLAFTPDGRQAVSASGDAMTFSSANSLFLWDLNTCTPLAILENLPHPPWDMEISPAGDVAVYGDNAGVNRWNFTTSQAQVLLDLSPQNVRSIAFSSDGRYLAVGPGRGQSDKPDFGLILLELEDPDPKTGLVQANKVRRFDGHHEAVTDLAFSPDGKYLLSGSLDKTVILWDVASGKQLKNLSGLSTAVLAVAFSPTGNLVAASDHTGQILMWTVPEGNTVRHFIGHTRPVFNLAFDPTGHILYSAAYDGTIMAWQADTHKDELLAWIRDNRYVAELTCDQKIQLEIVDECSK